MSGCLRHILPVAAGLFGVTVVWAGGGYLPQGGPAPLRFRVLPPTPPAKRMSQLVPPAVSVKEPGQTSQTSPTGQTGQTGQTNTVVPVAVPATTPPAVEYDARDFEIIGAPAPRPEALISPQMLIKYFTTTTNGDGMSAVKPVGFTPPTGAVPALPPPPNQTAPAASP